MQNLQKASTSHAANFRLLRAADVRPEDISAWKTLVQEAVEPNPFFEPEFVLPLSEARPEDNVHLVVVEQANRWTFCLPVVIRWGWRKMPVPVMATWLSQYTFLGTPLIAASEGPAPLLRLLQGVQHARAGLLVFEWVAANGPVSSMLRQVLSQCGSPFVQWERYERAALGRDVTCNPHLSNKRRAELGRKRRALERECGGVLKLVDRTGDPSAVDEFLELEASGWKGSEGTAIASRAADIAFFRKACSAMAEAGHLQMLALMGNRAVAMQCNFVSGNSLFGFRMCYDETLSRFSPGALLLFDAITHFYDSKAVWFDSCTAPDNELCNRLMHERQTIETLLVGGADPIGTTLVVTMRTASVLRQARGNMRSAGRLLSSRRWMHHLRVRQAGSG
ncbi:GNAT family N-acetyltransferase [Microvirga lenta]|uniref:GNAT family N-acetyltransferase n=1 Tax=Microvirga lenta TaxID=2881337 RepID=UPI001CFD0C29|nr:GNAT family N-acetyltransferase [Microvirga lenta]MCB5173886.1 GNAT family N-acetyltransferase [Microvirga lenta]